MTDWTADHPTTDQRMDMIGKKVTLLGTYDRPTEQPTNQQTDYDNNILTLVSV